MRVSQQATTTTTTTTTTTNHNHNHSDNHNDNHNDNHSDNHNDDNLRFTYLHDAWRQQLRQRQYIYQRYYRSIHCYCIAAHFHQQDQTSSNHMLAAMQKVPSVTAVPSISSCSSS